MPHYDVRQVKNGVM